jgi:hypothetical protein
MDPSLAVALFGTGAAILAFWAVVRFPALGPKTLGPSVLLMVAAFLLQTPLLGLARSVMVTFGVPAALLFVILPALTVLFWTAGCLIRTLVSLAAPFRH